MLNNVVNGAAEALEPQAQCEHDQQKYKDLYGNPDKTLKEKKKSSETQGNKNICSSQVYLHNVLIPSLINIVMITNSLLHTKSYLLIKAA